VEEATSFQTANGSNPESDWDQGYGYQFWQCLHNAYRGDGAFGQYCIVMPEQDAVIAITSGSDDMQGILNAVWEKLLPAMKEAPLLPNAEGLEELNLKLQDLAISYVEGEESSSIASGLSRKTYTLEKNDRYINSITFGFEDSLNEIIFTTDQGEQTIRVGYQEMEKGSLSSPFVVSDKVAANGAWTTPDTYTVNVIYYETPESVKFTFRFKDDALLWDTERKASFGPRNPSQLKAKQQKTGS
jgi:hypothetical protein